MRKKARLYQSPRHAVSFRAGGARCGLSNSSLRFLLPTAGRAAPGGRQHPRENSEKQNGRHGRPFRPSKSPFGEAWRAEALQIQSEPGDMRGGFGSLAQQGFPARFPGRASGAGETCPVGKGRLRRPFPTSWSGCKPLPLSCSARALRAQEHDVPLRCKAEKQPCSEKPSTRRCRRSKQTASPSVVMPLSAGLHGPF